MASVTAADQPHRTTRSRLASLLIPITGGPGEIVALDGLRALAALSVMLFHSYYTVARQVVFAGHDITFFWFYGQSGVDLFFVLSGFLLFTPFARAMLAGRPLPSIRRFFHRRALRILPAYWVCLAVLSLLQFKTLTSPTGFATILMHVVLLHDDVAVMNRAIEGPFWTLAVEAQFYVVLPLFAWAISRFVGATRSRRRLVLGVGAVIVGALALRAVDAFVQGHAVGGPGLTGTVARLFVRATLGTQGKYLEVFGLGMLCSVLYLSGQEESRRFRQRLPWIGLTLAVVGVVAMVPLAQLEVRREILTPPATMFWHATDALVIGGPLLAGAAYAGLMLGVLWGPRWLRAIFEVWPLRFIGLISYSLYLWHLPILAFTIQFANMLPDNVRIGFQILVGFFVAVPVAYLSYQFVERPFLTRRQGVGKASPAQASPAPEGLPGGVGAAKS